MDKDLAGQVADVPQPVTASGAISATGHGHVSLDGVLAEGGLPPTLGAVAATHAALYPDHRSRGTVHA